MSEVPRIGSRLPSGFVVAVLCLCGTIVALQQTLVVPLLPDYPRILHTTADNASWLVMATLLTSAVATQILSRAADMYGKRLLLLIVCLAGTAVTGPDGRYAMPLPPAGRDVITAVSADQDRVTSRHLSLVAQPRVFNIDLIAAGDSAMVDSITGAQVLRSNFPGA